MLLKLDFPSTFFRRLCSGSFALATTILLFAGCGQSSSSRPTAVESNRTELDKLRAANAEVLAVTPEELLRIAESGDEAASDPSSDPSKDDQAPGAEQKTDGGGIPGSGSGGADGSKKMAADNQDAEYSAFSALSLLPAAQAPSAANRLLIDAVAAGNAHEAKAAIRAGAQIDADPRWICNAKIIYQLRLLGAQVDRVGENAETLEELAQDQELIAQKQIIASKPSVSPEKEREIRRAYRLARISLDQAVDPYFRWEKWAIWLEGRRKEKIEAAKAAVAAIAESCKRANVWCENSRYKYLVGPDGSGVASPEDVGQIQADEDDFIYSKDVQTKKVFAQTEPARRQVLACQRVEIVAASSMADLRSYKALQGPVGLTVKPSQLEPYKQAGF